MSPNAAKEPAPHLKLHILFRIESGCLGPNGVDHVEAFCEFAQKELETLDAKFIHWDIVPRLDKEMEEMEFKVNGKKLSAEKADRYLQRFDHNLDEFEDHLHRRLAQLINEHMKF